MDFVAPKPSPAVICLTRALLPHVLRLRRIAAVEYGEGDLERLRSLADHRLLFLPNHPTNVDPAILYHLSKTLGEPFFYLCAREVFDMRWGLWGALVRRCGAYSIMRGTPDRASFKKTRELLARPRVRLVIFPEGQVDSQNDTLLPFHSGVTQLVFWAQDDLLKNDEREPILIFPVALKYKFVSDMRQPIVAALSRLEAALGLPSDAGEDDYQRLRRIGETVVAKLEVEYAFEPKEQASLDTRMEALKEAIVSRVAEALRVCPPDGELPDQMRHLINVLHRVTDEEPPHPCLYDARLWVHHRERVRPMLRDLDRLANWIAVHDGYVAAHPSPERMAELIQRLEIEVFGRRQCLGKQRCLVRIGEAVNVLDYYEQYTADKRKTVDWLTDQFEVAIEAMLEEAAQPA